MIAHIVEKICDLSTRDTVLCTLTYTQHDILDALIDGNVGQKENKPKREKLLLNSKYGIIETETRESHSLPKVIVWRFLNIKTFDFIMGKILWVII